jgi:hypothetical protein
MRLRAIGLTLALLIGGSLRAQSRPSEAAGVDTSPLFRNPATARVLGTLLPGAGHVYAGEYGQAVAYYAGAVSGIGGGFGLLALHGAAQNKEPAWPSQVGSAVLFAFGAWVWVRSSMDAPRAAERANVRHANEARVSFVFREPNGGAAGTSVGLAVAW